MVWFGLGWIGLVWFGLVLFCLCCLFRFVCRVCLFVCLFCLFVYLLIRFVSFLLLLLLISTNITLHIMNMKPARGSQTMCLRKMRRAKTKTPNDLSPFLLKVLFKI